MPPAERLRRNLSDLKRAETGGTCPLCGPRHLVQSTSHIRWDNGYNGP